MNKWFSLDYAGWEQVCFSLMLWRFNCSGQDEDERRIKREGDKWFITDDWGDWVLYGETAEEMELIESYYQQYVAEELEKEVWN